MACRLGQLKKVKVSPGPSRRGEGKKRAMKMFLGVPPMFQAREGWGARSIETWSATLLKYLLRHSKPITLT